MKKSFGLFIAFLMLVGCVTTYQPVGFTGGYSDTQLQPNMFRVIFRGNGYTSAERASDFCLLRCAELALQNSYPYFVIVDASNGVGYSTYTTPTQSTTTGSAFSNGNSTFGNAQTITYGGQTHIIAKPSSTNTILCFKDKPDNSNTLVYDAAFLSNSIKQKYGITDTSGTN
jgi:hypothetical protein